MKTPILAIIICFSFCFSLSSQTLAIKSFVIEGEGTYFHILENEIPLDTFHLSPGRGKVEDFIFEEKNKFSFISNIDNMIYYYAYEKNEYKWEFKLNHLIYIRMIDGVYNPKKKHPSNFKFINKELISYQCGKASMEVSIESISDSLLSYCLMVNE